MKNKQAFTLAEILIATLVIGIVAALSLPVFFNMTIAHSKRSKFMKIMSNLTQASTASYATDSYDFSGANGYYGEPNQPISTAETPGGAADGNIIGFNTPSVESGYYTHSDMYKDTTSLFHIFQDNLRLKHSTEVQNYAVNPASLELNCAGREEEAIVSLRIPPNQVVEATLKTNFLAREYYTDSVVQGAGGLASMCNGRSVANGGFNQGRMFMMEDGSVFTYDPAQAYCFETNPCYGYIDINGSEGPNRVISCSEGMDSYITSYSKNALPGMLKGQCTVKDKDVTDIYPVLFYNQVVKPASWSSKSVYFKLTSNQIEKTENKD